MLYKQHIRIILANPERSLLIDRQMN